jgi:hypothetical protein
MDRDMAKQRVPAPKPTAPRRSHQGVLLSGIWALAHPRTGYHGAFPYGFLERARVAIGCGEEDSVLHVCSGAVAKYPYWGFGPCDYTLDIRTDVDPDFCQDARDEWSIPPDCAFGYGGVIIDPPYDRENQERYGVAESKLPTCKQLLQNAEKALRVGGRVGILHWIVPAPVEGLIQIGVFGVIAGTNCRIRAFTVYEKRG